MAITQNWNLGRRSKICLKTERPFEDGETIVTAVLAPPGTDEFERREYCLEAWEEVRPTLEVFSFWRTKFEVPVAENKNEEVVEKESAEMLLRRLIDEDDPKTENARFVLAVMLERKRNLKEVEKKDAENGSRLLIYEHPKSGDVLIIRDPMLKLDEVESVQEEVSALLAPKPAPKTEEAEVEAAEPEESDEGRADEDDAGDQKEPAESVDVS